MKNGAFITSKSQRVAVFILTSIAIFTPIFILIVFRVNPQAAYNGAIVQKYGSDPANHPIYDDDLWKQCAGADQKGGVFGWGSMSDPQYTMTGTPSTTRCTGAPSGSKDVQNYLDSVRGELKEELKEEMKANLKVEMKNQLMEEMREELKEEMREDLKEETRKEIQGMLVMLVDYGIKSRVTRQKKNKAR